MAIISKLKSKQALPGNNLSAIAALITNLPDVCIATGIVDCVSLLILDPCKKVLAVVHVGWRSTVAKIAVKTALQMFRDFGCRASDIVVGIGPSICAENFEVGEEVGEKFVTAGFDMSIISYRNRETNRLHIDLWKANK